MVPGEGGRNSDREGQVGVVSSLVACDLCPAAGGVTE